MFYVIDFIFLITFSADRLIINFNLTTRVEKSIILICFSKIATLGKNLRFEKISPLLVRNYDEFVEDFFLMFGDLHPTHSSFSVAFSDIVYFYSSFSSPLLL